MLTKTSSKRINREKVREREREGESQFKLIQNERKENTVTTLKAFNWLKL